jgi:heat shock protein HtpX
VCALADMPKPRIAIAQSPLPNAFATGRNADKAVLCVTSAMMSSRFTPEELEAVIAHEMSHVAHKDVQVMTIASFLAIVAALLIRFSFYGELFGGGRRSNNNNGGAGYIFLIIMGVSIAVYAISFLLIRMLSRYRELAADRSGALLTGQPSALKSALVKVSEGINRIPTKDLRSAEPLNAFFFAPAAHLSANASKLSTIFSTHPSLERRLAELDKVQRQLSQRQ